MLENFSVGWGVLAFINAGLAQIKYHMSGNQGYGGLAWFFLSLFLGPTATFIIVVYKRPSNAR